MTLFSKRNIIIIVSLLLMFSARLVPPFMGLNASSIQVLGIFFGVLLLWLTVSIDWPSILLLGALALVPELKFSSILAGAFGNTTFVFLMFTFILTYALSKTSIIKRVALRFIRSNIAQKGPWHFVILYFSSILFIGSFISPTVLFFVYLPILEEIYSILGLKKKDKLAAMLMMGTVIMCGISSGMTPVAHVFPLIAMGLYSDVMGMTISYIDFMMVAIPVGIITAILVILVFYFVLRPEMSSLRQVDFHHNFKNEEPLMRKEKIILIVFGLVVFLWIAPSIVTSFFQSGWMHDVFAYIDGFGTAMPPLIGIILLSILEEDGAPILNLNEAMTEGVSWPSLVMCAGTLALGSAMTNSAIGLTSWLSSSLTPFISGLSPLLIAFVFTLWAAIQTNVSSNMVTSTLVSTALLTIAGSLNGVNIAALIINIGIMSSFAFATPPAMPCVAIASSSGWTNTMQMMKYGFIAMFLSVITASLIGYPIALMVL